MKYFTIVKYDVVSYSSLPCIIIKSFTFWAVFDASSGRESNNLFNEIISINNTLSIRSIHEIFTS